MEVSGDDAVADLAEHCAPAQPLLRTLEKLIALSVRNKLLVASLGLWLVAWGGFSAANLPLAAMLDVANNQVQVIAQSPALAAQKASKASCKE